MKALNEMKLSFDSRSSNEAFARTAVGSFIAQLDPTVAELSDIKTAVSEAVTNCVVHAYGDSIGKISINVKSRKLFLTDILYYLSFSINHHVFVAHGRIELPLQE